MAERPLKGRSRASSASGPETDGGTCSNDGRLPESDGILDGLRIVAVVADVEGTEFLVEDMAAPSSQ